MKDDNPTTMTATKLMQAEFARIERRLEFERKVFNQTTATQLMRAEFEKFEQQYRELERCLAGLAPGATRATDCLINTSWPIPTLPLKPQRRSGGLIGPQSNPTHNRGRHMNDESIHEEMAALMQHMVRRGVSRKTGAYMMACTIGNVLGAFCEDDDSKALVLAALVRVARIRAGLPELN